MSDRQLRQNPAVALLIGVAAWMLPGAGHVLLRQITRGIAVFFSVGALAGIAVAVHGRLFGPHSTDFFDFLGYVADCGAGLFFLLAQKWNNGGPDVAHAAGDYGTRFFAAAGVLNVLAAVDAYRIARGEEQHEEEEEDRPAGDANSPADGADPASQLHLSSDAEGEAQTAPEAAGEPEAREATEPPKE